MFEATHVDQDIVLSKLSLARRNSIVLVIHHPLFFIRSQKETDKSTTI